MIAVRLPIELENSLSNLSLQTGKTRAFHIRNAIAEYVEKVKNKKRFETWAWDYNNPEVVEDLKRECEQISKCPEDKEWLDFAEQNLNEFAKEWKY